MRAPRREASENGSSELKCLVIYRPDTNPLEIVRVLHRNRGLRRLLRDCQRQRQVSLRSEAYAADADDARRRSIELESEGSELLGIECGSASGNKRR